MMAAIGQQSVVDGELNQPMAIIVNRKT